MENGKDTCMNQENFGQNDNPLFDKNILLIEDDSLFQEIVRRTLESSKCNLTIASDGIEALKCLKSNVPDIIIMDIKLPHIDGYKLTQTIRKDDHLKNVPIIAVTAYAMQEDRKAFLAAGCNDYLSKPVDLKDFLNLLKKYS